MLFRWKIEFVSVGKYILPISSVFCTIYIGTFFFYFLNQLFRCKIKFHTQSFLYRKFSLFAKYILPLYLQFPPPNLIALRVFFFLNDPLTNSTIQTSEHLPRYQFYMTENIDF